MDKIPARILFVPVCSKCGQRIEGPVSFQYLYETGNSMDYSINPQTCPHCNAFFEQIIMPTSLPFYGYEKGETWK